MAYTIRLTREAERQLRRMVKHQLIPDRLAPRIDALAENPRPSGCKKLTGHGTYYRIRIGDLRVVYQVDDECAEVLVLVVAHRREVYRDLRRLLRE